jgi:hypothetical protein
MIDYERIYMIMMGTLNVIMAVTNITAIYPIKYAFLKKDYTTSLMTSCVALFSTFSHLFESHKHKMWGFGIGQNTSLFLNQLDRLGVFLLVGRSFYLWWLNGKRLTIIKRRIGLFIAISGSFLLNILSEQDYGYDYYIPLHSFWHLSIYLLFRRFLKIIYE